MKNHHLGFSISTFVLGVKNLSEIAYTIVIDCCKARKGSFSLNPIHFITSLACPLSSLVKPHFFLDPLNLQYQLITMLKTAVALLLLTTAASLSTYSYSFPTTSSSSYQTPSYPLGQLTQNNNLTIAIQLPFGGAMLISSYLIISIMDSTNSITAVSFDDFNPIRCNGGTTCTLWWTVTATSSYFLKVQSTSPSTQLNNLALYYLSASVGNNVIVRVTDVIRQHMIKYFTVLQKANVTFTITPQLDTSTFFTLLTIDPTTATNLRVLKTTTLTPTTTVNSVGTYVSDLISGYYAIIVSTNTPTAVTITFQSDPYPCPYSSNFADYFSIFSGCTRSSITSTGSGLPCITYDYNSQACLSCMSGYSVSQGTCVTNTNCGARQYYKFGNCYLVSSTCGLYDPYTGDCLSCADPSQYQLINGQCVLNNNYCSPGFRLVNSQCISNLCGSYSQQTGLCLTCISAAYNLTSGVCVAVDCNSTSLYYSVKAAACVGIPVACSNFSIAYEVCYTCITGYTLTNGICLQYSNTNNCMLYNFAANVCSTCYPGYYVLNGGCILTPVCNSGQQLVNGICVLIPSNCGPTQMLVNGQCANLPANCLSMNTLFQCTQCVVNYQIVSGTCIPCRGINANFPCVTCLANQYVDNSGNCQNVSPFCSAFNNGNGQCISCINGQSPVNGICCGFGQIYQYGSCSPLSTIVTPSNNGNQGSSNSDSGSSGSSSSGGSSGSSGSSTSSLRSKYGIYCATIDPQLQICKSCMSGHFFGQGNVCV